MLKKESIDLLEKRISRIEESLNKKRKDEAAQVIVKAAMFILKNLPAVVELIEQIKPYFDNGTENNDDEKSTLDNFINSAKALSEMLTKLKK